MDSPSFSLPGETVYDGMTLVKAMADYAPEVKNMETTEKDIYIATYPRSGTTWISEVMCMIRFHGDMEAMSKVPRFQRVFFLEMDTGPKGTTVMGIDLAKKELGKPRVLMTHLPYRYVAKQVEENKTKVVFVLRNIRDVWVSIYNFYKSNPGLGNYKGSWSEFFDDICRPEKVFYGDWLKHTKTYWEQRHLENVHVIFYENAVDNLDSTVRKLASFMGEDLTEEQINQIVQHAQFDSMQERAGKIFRGKEAAETLPEEAKKNIAGNFFRQGKYGTWRNTFTKEQDDFVKEKYDKLVAELGIELQN